MQVLILGLHQIELVAVFGEVLSALDEPALRRPDLDAVPPAVLDSGRILDRSDLTAVANDIVRLVLDVVLHCAYSMATLSETASSFLLVRRVVLDSFFAKGIQLDLEEGFEELRIS